MNKAGHFFRLLLDLIYPPRASFLSSDNLCPSSSLLQCMASAEEATVYLQITSKRWKNSRGNPEVVYFCLATTHSLRPGHSFFSFKGFGRKKSQLSVAVSTGNKNMVKLLHCWFLRSQGRNKRLTLLPRIYEHSIPCAGPNFTSSRAPCNVVKPFRWLMK